MTPPESATMKRLGRAVVYVHEHDTGQIPQKVAAEIEALLTAGRAMDFAARLKSFGSSDLTHAVVMEFAKQAGIGRPALLGVVLPALATADVVGYTTTGDVLVGMEEYVGVTGTLMPGIRPDLGPVKLSDTTGECPRVKLHRGGPVLVGVLGGHVDERQQDRQLVRRRPPPLVDHGE